MEVLLRLLDETESWDFCLVQERGVAGAELTLDAVESPDTSHSVWCNPDRPWDTAIIAHSRWKGRKEGSGHCPGAVGIKFRTGTSSTTLVSAHLLHSWGNQETDTFDGALSELSSLLAGPARP